MNDQVNPAGADDLPGEEAHKAAQREKDAAAHAERARLDARMRVEMATAMEEMKLRVAARRAGSTGWRYPKHPSVEGKTGDVIDFSDPDCEPTDAQHAAMAQAMKAGLRVQAARRDAQLQSELVKAMNEAESQKGHDDVAGERE